MNTKKKFHTSWPEKVKSWIKSWPNERKPLRKKHTYKHLNRNYVSLNVGHNVCEFVFALKVIWKNMFCFVKLKLNVSSPVLLLLLFSCVIFCFGFIFGDDIPECVFECALVVKTAHIINFDICTVKFDGSDDELGENLIYIFSNKFSFAFFPLLLLLFPSSVSPKMTFSFLLRFCACPKYETKKKHTHRSICIFLISFYLGIKQSTRCKFFFSVASFWCVSLNVHFGYIDKTKYRGQHFKTKIKTHICQMYCTK